MYRVKRIRYCAHNSLRSWENLRTEQLTIHLTFRSYWNVCHRTGLISVAHFDEKNSTVWFDHIIRELWLTTRDVKFNFYSDLLNLFWNFSCFHEILKNKKKIATFHLTLINLKFSSIYVSTIFFTHDDHVGMFYLPN